MKVHYKYPSTEYNLNQIAKHLTDSLRNFPDCLAQKTPVAYQAGGNEDDTRETMRLEIDTILHTLSQEVPQFEL
jgi:hypothetical protein